MTQAAVQEYLAAVRARCRAASKGAKGRLLPPPPGCHGPGGSDPGPPPACRCKCPCAPLGNGGTWPQGRCKPIWCCTAAPALRASTCPAWWRWMWPPGGPRLIRDVATVRDGPVAVLAGVAGMSALARFDWGWLAAAVLSFLVAALSGAGSRLDPAQKAHSSRAAGSACTSLHDHLPIHRLIDLAEAAGMTASGAALRRS